MASGSRLLIVLGTTAVLGVLGYSLWQGQATTAGAGYASILDTREFETVKAEASAASKLLVAKFTATWCPPCKLMDTTTWVDSGVIDWVKKNGAAVAVDVDQRAELAQQFGINGIPTMVAMRGDKELGRVVGYQDPSQLLAWMKEMAAKQ